MKPIDPFEYIRDRLPQEELLAQLAEECAELGKAALKLRRVYDGTNPTPVKRSEAYDNLIEEISDVLLCLDVLQLKTHEIIRISTNKMVRWVNRLKEAEAPEK